MANGREQRSRLERGAKKRIRPAFDTMGEREGKL